MFGRMYFSHEVKNGGWLLQKFEYYKYENYRENQSLLFFQLILILF